MITYVEGDLFNSPAQVLVNTVNTVGVMGKGVALRFKRAFPDMFTQYQSLCESGQLQIGRLWLYRGPERWVLNFPTKKHWRNPSRVEYIESGLAQFRSAYADSGIASIAFPQLGCGNGELDWPTQVLPLMEQYLDRLPIDVFVHLYPSDRVPEHRTPAEMHRWLRLEVESLAFSEVWDDIVALVNDNSDFETLADRVPFRATVVQTDEQALRMTTQHGTVDVPRSALLGLWQQLRAYGYVMPRVLEAEFEPHFTYLVAILGRLPYVRSVRVAGNPDKLSRPTSFGLQWAPRVRRKGQLGAAAVVRPQLV